MDAASQQAAGVHPHAMSWVFYLIRRPSRRTYSRLGRCSKKTIHDECGDELDVWVAENWRCFLVLVSGTGYRLQSMQATETGVKVLTVLAVAYVVV
jgi:hypothetical protein